MRLDHLLSKDWICVGWLPGRVLSGSLNGSGPAGGLPLRKAGRPTVSRGFVLAGGVGLSGAWCRKHARCCLMGGGGCPCVCGGGMLSGFWGSAPWLPDLSGAPGCPGVVGGCGWVGCELYSGREHLTVMISATELFLVLFVCLCCLFF